MSHHEPAMTPDRSSKEGSSGPQGRCDRCGAPTAGVETPCPACMLLAAQQGPPGAGVGFEAPSVQEVAEALPAYEVQLLIGQGGMGAVYRARHRKLDRLVAIKVLRPLASNDEGEAAAFTERFEREAQVLARLDHPHIVRIYDFGRGEGESPFFYLVLEFVDGASLRELMQSGRLTAPEALALIPQVCEALHTAHALGVVHRDIKPENILVDGEGRVRIADFGLAKLTAADEALPLTQTNQLFGTPHYMAPEQMRSSGGVDHRADLYSLGVVLYELLTGELPLGRFAAPSEKGGASAGLDDIVFKALAAEPDERYQGADEILSDLEQPGRHGDEEAPAEGASNTLEGSRRLRRSKRRRALERSRLEGKYGDLADEGARVEPSSVRTGIVFFLMLMLHAMPWIEVHSIGGSVLSLSQSPTGNDVSVFGIPLIFGQLALLLCAVLKGSVAKDQASDPKWIYGLAHVGMVLTQLFFIEMTLRGTVYWLISPAYLALALYCFSSWMEHSEYRRVAEYRQLRGMRADREKPEARV